jgi:hypothetical protein
VADSTSLYISDSGNNRVIKVPVAGGAPIFAILRIAPKRVCPNGIMSRLGTFRASDGTAKGAAPCPHVISRVNDR